MAGYRPKRGAAALLCGVVGLLMAAAATVRADKVEMQNGDRYTGRVLELNTNSIVIENEVLGKVTIPRRNVATIVFGVQSGTNSIPLILSGATNNPARSRAKGSSPAVPAPGTPDMRQINTNSALIQTVEDQFLRDAAPEAKAKFHEMLGGLAEGKLDINDIRTQAKDAVDQIHSIQKDAGGEAGGMLDAYAAILEKFLKETAPAGTNAAVPPPKLNLAPRDGQ